MADLHPRFRGSDMSFDWITGLFQSEQTRGLSGDGAHAVALDESNPFYNFRLRRHVTPDDLVSDVGLLWQTDEANPSAGGLGSHIHAQHGDGTANFTDVMFILSREDHDRAVAEGLDDWSARARKALSERFEAHSRSEQFARIYNQRPLIFNFLVEGSEEMGGQELGLGPGEFITGLLPNHYTGPRATSKGIIAVHLNLPGVWEGYQEVGQLYDDQILFTLGNHWLDNFGHPSLQEAALYRLQQYPDGSFVHIVNPDLQDRYQVTSVQQEGTNVLTLATREGTPLAYLVLALVEGSGATPAPAPGRADIAMPVAPASPLANPTIPPDVAPPMLIDDVLQPVDPAPRRRGSKTIIPEAPSERILTLQERGALLQRVHFSSFMAGYDVFVSKRGELGTVVDAPAAAFQVRKRSVSVKAFQELTIDGRRINAGEEVPVEGDIVLEIGTERLEYRDLRNLDLEKWPYVGEIHRPASSTYLIWGEEYKIGRSRECRVVMPDEPRNDNIHWKPEVGDGATIRARTGEIPKSRFYTDSIMVASEHATLDTRSDIPKVVCNARHCFVYVRRGSNVQPLFPSTSGKSPQESDLEPGDELLIGNCLFHVGYSSQDAEAFVAPVMPAPRMSPEPPIPAPQPLSADDLAAAVAEPAFDDPETGEVPLDDEPLIDAATLLNEEVDHAEQEDDEPAPSADEPSPLIPMEDPVPLGVVGMASVLGAELRTVADEEEHLRQGLLDNPPIQVPALEETGDDPTTPGMMIPAGLLDEEEDEEEDEGLLQAEDALSEDPLTILRTTPSSSDWEEDDGDDESVGDDATGFSTIPHSPTQDPVTDGVSEPFPELSEQEEPTEMVDRVDESTEVPVIPEAPSSDAVETTIDANEELEEEPPTEAVTRIEVPEPDAAIDPVEDEEPPTEAVARPATDEDEDEDEDEDAPPFGDVVFTDDDEAQFELGRPLHIVQAGWTVKGEVTAGNHTTAELVIPENRITAGQRFQPCDYFTMKVRGRRGHLDVLSKTELLIDETDPEQDRYENLADLTIDVVRRDDLGEEDFVVRLIVAEDRSLPDPRARFVALDYEDALAAALVTRGVGLDQPRELTMGGITMTVTWNGDALTLSDYLETYRGPDGFIPFFVQQGDKRFVTAPENGDPIELHPGDRFVCHSSVYLVRGV